MISVPRLLHSHGWKFALAIVAVVLMGTNLARIQHVEFVSNLAHPELSLDGGFASGYRDNQRRLVAPERDFESYQWIAQTQEMFGRGEWRLRQVETDNYPFGRSVDTTAPYRWYLGGLGWLHHHITGTTLGRGIEQASQYADPLLHLILLLTSVPLVVRFFGAGAGVALAAGFIGIFPWSGSYQPALPSAFGLGFSLSFGSALLLLIGVHQIHSKRPANIWLWTSGVLGGFALWIEFPSQIWPLLGILGGVAIYTTIRIRGEAVGAEVSPFVPWSRWAAGGALTVTVGYLVEFLGAKTGAEYRGAIHPTLAMGWLCFGLVVEHLEKGHGFSLTRTRRTKSLSYGIIAVVGGATTLAFLRTAPVEFWSGSPSMWQLSSLPQSPVFPDLFAWWATGTTFTQFATLVPLLVLALSGWRITRASCSSLERGLLGMMMAGTVICLVGAFGQLRVWGAVDLFLLMLVVLLATNWSSEPTSANNRLRWIGLTLILAPGFVHTLPNRGTAAPDTLTAAEAQVLVERNLAHWLRQRVGSTEAVVFAPAQLAASIGHYSGLPTIGTPFAENEAGLTASLRIASATSEEEALLLIENRGITHIAMPTWEPMLAAPTDGSAPSATFAASLSQWNLPLWLRPLPYQIPQIAGWESQTIDLFAVVEQQSPADALGRQAEYFLEMGLIGRAQQIQARLGSFPSHLGALAARAQFALATQDGTAFENLVEVIEPLTQAGAARILPWDRRVSLITVLTQAQARELAREQLERCLATIDDNHLRDLSPGSLYRFHLLCRMLDRSIPDAKLHRLALELLPPESRTRLQR